MFGVDRMVVVKEKGKEAPWKEEQLSRSFTKASV